MSTYTSAADQVAHPLSPDEEPLIVPYGITVDAKGSLYVTDGERVLKVGTDGHVAKADDPQTAGVSSFYAPTALAVDTEGNIYVTDIHDWVIYKINTKGKVSIFYGVKNTADQTTVLTSAIRESYGLLVAGNYVYASRKDNGFVFRIDK